MTRMLLSSRRPAQLSLAACLMASGLLAQNTTSLRGAVTDPQGAVIPGVGVTLANPETGQTRQTITGSGGDYQFVQIPPGSYKVNAEAPGFASITQDNVKLLVNTPASLDIHMQLGQTTETVDVNAQTTQLNAVDASIGNAFTERQVRQLPLLTRNVVELLSLQPGVTPTGEVLGARRDQNNITLDGVDVNNNQNAGLGGASTSQGSNANGVSQNAGFNSVLPIPLDSVEEFRVTVAGQGADEGRSSGGQVVLVTKSGTNQIHGSAYEYNRNTLFAANTWFNNRSDVARQPLNRNQFGASLGGPAIKNRLFFFFNYERRIDASGTAVERAVPTASLKAGNLVLQDTNGNTYTLGPQAIQQIDPLHVGLNAGYMKLLNQYPGGNDAPYGADAGLNFTGLRFNAPDHLDDRAYVGRVDYILDSAAKNTLSLRGTLFNENQDNPQYLAQFPGQSSASQLLNDSKGVAANFTSVLRPNLLNLFTYGYTRYGLAYSGVNGVGLFLGNLDPLQNYNARASSQFMPVNNFADTLTWTKGTHTVTAGINFRLIANQRSNYTNSYASYGFNTSLAVGLGEDIQTGVTSYMAQQTGNPNFQLANPNAVAAAMGILLGLTNNVNVTYQFLRNGSVLPQGQPQMRDFVVNEYEGFVGDSWKVTPHLTLSYGLRYQLDPAPYEANGLQVASTYPLDSFFGQRDYLQGLGVPSNAMPNALLSYALNGPVNGKASWYGTDWNNFAPRFSVAYSPAAHDNWLGKIFGPGGVIRAGYAMMYDTYGSDLITQFDQFGSQGLATTLGSPLSYNYTTSPRFNGTVPAMPGAPTGGFPYTPPDVHAIVGEYSGIYPSLVAPYSHLFNASFERELPGGLTLDAGYVGRLSHKLLLQGDIFTPLEGFKDPRSGETWLQAMTQIRNLNNTGLSPNSVQNSPNSVPSIPFIQDMFPTLANYYFPGSASANYYYGIYGVYGGSYLDMLHAMDRIPQANGQCISVSGCYTFFARQGSSMPTWMNAGNAVFNALTVSLRRAYKSGFSFDFNYTWSHSIDNGSTAEGAAGHDGAVIQNVFAPGQFRGSSDFDIRHLVNANFVYELPFGHGKPMFGNASGWLDEIVGGWQVSSIIRLSSGLPTVIQGNQTWNTNYWQSSLAIPVARFKSGTAIDVNGNPGLFGNPGTAVNAFADQYPGQTGMRAIMRLPGQKNTDLALSKRFAMPWEGQSIQFRAEAFNAFNNVNFVNPSLALYLPTTFGEFTDTTAPRVMQFAMRYEF